jgi:death-on-curing protein
MARGEPVWVYRNVLEAVHGELIAEHGGLGGLRDGGLLESALARPRQAYHYGTDDLFELAAAYTMGLARNHPFADGNKRIAFLAAYIFLARNGFRLRLPEAETVIVMNRVAAGTLAEPELAGLFRGASVATET